MVYKTLAAPAAGAQIAVDEVVGVGNVGRTKVGFGAEGQIADVSPASPLPVTQDAIVAALADVATGADTATIVAALQATLAVTGPLTDAQLRAAALAVTVAALPLPTGAATSARQDAIIAALGAALQVTGPLTDGQLRAAAVAISAAALPLPAGAATAAKQDAATAAIDALRSPDYEAVAANAAGQVLGAAGAAGDLLTSLLIVPATTSPGAVSIRDGAGAAIVVFAGGANSVSTLHPFAAPLGALSAAGAWSVNTGANVSVVAVGNFS